MNKLSVGVERFLTAWAVAIFLQRNGGCLCPQSLVYNPSSPATLPPPPPKEKKPPLHMLFSCTNNHWKEGVEAVFNQNRILLSMLFCFTCILRKNSLCSAFVQLSWSHDCFLESEVLQIMWRWSHTKVITFSYLERIESSYSYSYSAQDVKLNCLAKITPLIKVMIPLFDKASLVYNDFSLYYMLDD